MGYYKPSSLQIFMGKVFAVVIAISVIATLAKWICGMLWD